MREITFHKNFGLNDSIRIYAIDEPGHGGGNHLYELCIGDVEHPLIQHVRFQQGPVGETGPNGVSNEALLAIVADRLEGFQSGPFACNDNAIALNYVRNAIHQLGHRTAIRIKRGVEGTSTP